MQVTLIMLLRRYFAWMIDAAFVLALGLIFSLVFGQRPFGSNDIINIAWVIYGTLLDASSWQGTIGKRILRMKVMTENGNKISLFRSAIRNSFRIFPVFMFFSALWLLFSSGRQCLHDKFAGTIVE